MGGSISCCSCSGCSYCVLLRWMVVVQSVTGDVGCDWVAAVEQHNVFICWVCHNL